MSVNKAEVRSIDINKTDKINLPYSMTKIRYNFQHSVNNTHVTIYNSETDRNP